MNRREAIRTLLSAAAIAGTSPLNLLGEQYVYRETTTTMDPWQFLPTTTTEDPGDWLTSNECGCSDTEEWIFMDEKAIQAVAPRLLQL